MPATWILVGDASRARIYAREKQDGPWALVQELEHPPGRARTSELVSDRAGRQRQSSVRTPPLESHMPPPEQESLRFAERLGHLLQKGYDGRRFARLVLVAPPRFLGYLRSVLRDTVARHVVASFDKDYTHLDERALRRLLEPQLPAERERA